MRPSRPIQGLLSREIKASSPWMGIHSTGYCLTLATLTLSEPALGTASQGCQTHLPGRHGGGSPTASWLGRNGHSSLSPQCLAHSEVRALKIPTYHPLSPLKSLKLLFLIFGKLRPKDQKAFTQSHTVHTKTIACQLQPG
jgi:hypothetical protein